MWDDPRIMLTFGIALGVPSLIFLVFWIYLIITEWPSWK
jgi:hypothetical protein